MLWFQKGIVCLLMLVLPAAVPAWAESSTLLEHPRTAAGRKSTRLWKWSVAALAAGSAADAWSSMGRLEANPLLRGPGGRFSVKGVGIKAAIAGSSVATQWLLLRKRPESAKAAALTNFGMAGVFSGVAVRNRRLGEAPPARATALR